MRRDIEKQRYLSYLLFAEAVRSTLMCCCLLPKIMLLPYVHDIDLVQAVLEQDPPISVFEAKGSGQLPRTHGSYSGLARDGQNAVNV